MVAGTQSRRVLRFLSVTLIFATAGLVTFTLAARTEEPTVTPAGPDEATYRLSDFVFEYPFAPRDSSQDSPPSPGFAGLSFRSEWVGGTFPGDGECQVTLLGSDGTVVGSWYVLITTLTPTVTQGPWSVEVTGPPSSATAWCGAAKAPSGEYAFEDIAITDDPETRHGPKITGTVLAPGGTSGTHHCIANVRLADGSVTPLGFTMEGGDGTPLNVLLPPDLSSATSATISCEPYTGATS